MAEMELRVYRQNSQVTYFDADVRLRMSPMAYWRTFQNAAAAHAALLSAATEELRKAGQTWMLSKMKLVVDRHPMLGESLMVETWPSTRIKGARAYRDFVLKDAGGQVCARASSLWVIVDLAMRRPMRIPDSIAALSMDPGYEIPALTEGWLEAPGGEVSRVCFRACWSDADQNEHVNNVVMLRWGVDALPLPFLETHEIVSAETHYRAEVNVGDEVSVLTSIAGTNVRQAVYKDDLLVALLESEWKISNPSPVAP